MIIICKQSVNPSRDAAGAVRAAQSFHKTASPRVVGYRQGYLVRISELNSCSIHSIQLIKTLDSY